uniref:Uncharacterized protein n=1 Tax=Prolemur simus TaxID=1328070 RepID=A0A8C9ACH0_PROSS
MVLFKFLEESLANKMGMDWRGQQEGRETIEGAAKVVQVRDNDVDFEIHLGGIDAISWIWGIMQSWGGLEDVTQGFGLINE